MALTPEQLSEIRSGLYGDLSSIYEPTDVPSRQDTNNRLTTYAKAFKGGAVSGLASLLHGVDLVGDVLGKQLQTPEAVADALDKYVNQYYTPEDTGFDVDVVRGLGNLVTNAVPAILVAIAGGVIAPGAAATGLASAIGIPIYASLEALQEAGASYNEALENTNMDVEIAKQKASLVFAANVVLNIGTGYLGGFAGAGKEVARRSVRYGKAAIGEGLQEASQEVISQSIMKGTVSPEEVLYSGAVGAAVGGIAAPITTKAPKKKDKPGADITNKNGVTSDQQKVLHTESVINQKEEAKTKIRSAAIKDAVSEKEQKTLAEQQLAAANAQEQAQRQKVEQDKIELDLYNKKNSTRDGLVDSVAKYQEVAIDNKDAKVSSLMSSVHDVLSSASIDGIESIPGSKLTSLMSKVDIWRRSKKVKDSIDLSLANTIYKELDSIKAQQLQTKREEVLSKKKEEKPTPTTVKEEPTPPVAEVVTPEATPAVEEDTTKYTEQANKLTDDNFTVVFDGYQEGIGAQFTAVPKGMSTEQALTSGQARTFYGKNLTEARVKLRQATKDITTAKKEEVKEKTSKKKLTKAEEEFKEKAKEKKPKNKPSKAKPKKEVVEKKVEDEEDVDEFEEELPSKANAKEEGPIALTAEVKKEAKELSKEEADAFVNKFEENNSPDIIKFVQNKVKEFGTLSKVDSKYNTGSDIDTYAREKARQLFGRTKQDEVRFRLDRRRIESKKKKEEPIAKPKENISEKKFNKAIAKAFTNRISTKLNGRVRIVIHDSVSEVDSETYAAMKRDNALDAKGLYGSDRTIRIFLDQITDLNDFKKTLWHELGHFSFRDILGSRLDSDLKNVYNKYKDEISEYAARFDEVIGDENQNKWTEEYIIMKWTDWKTRPIGRKIQDSIMRILGMTERSEFYIYFRPMYDYVKKNRPIRTIVVSEDGFRYRKTPMVNQVSDPLAVQAINAVGVEHPYTFVDRAKRRLAKDFRTQFTDYTLPIKQYEEKVTKNLSGYIARRLSASVPTNFGAVLHFGLPRYDQNINWWTVEKSKDGGLLSVIQKLGDTSRWFELWQIARSAEELVSIRRRQYTKQYMDAGLRGTALTDKVNKEVESFKKKLFGKNKQTGEYYKYNEIINGLKLASDKKYLENKKLWDWADIKLKEFNKAMLDAAQASGIIDPVTRKEWERSIYVPFNREVEDWITGEVGVKGRFAKKSDVGGITRLEGGEGTIGNPINNLIGNYLFLMNESMKNITRIKSFNSLVAAGGIDPKKLNPVVGKSKKNAISIKKNGKAEYYEVNDPDLYVALTGLNNDYLNGALFDIMRASKSLLTKGVSFSVGFRMRNLLRDTLTAATIEPSFRPFVDTFKGLKAVMNTSPEYIRLISLGGTFGEGFYNIEDHHSLQAYLNRLFKGTTEAETSKFSVKGMIRSWENIGVALENATRVGLYMRKLDTNGNELDAAFTARDLLDFSKRGDLSSLNLITSVIPFLNARIQGLDKLYQSSKLPENRVNFFANGIVMAGISLLLYSINRDKEEYKDLPEYDRFSNVHFFIGDTHLRMPIPFEYGVIFSKLPQALADVATTGDYKTFLNFLKFSTTQIFDFDPRNVQAFKPLLEISANKSFYTGAPIIPMSLQGLAPKDQYDYSTSSLARLFGDTLNISPKKVDHIIEGYTSSIGVFALNLHNMIANQAHRHLPDTASVDFFFGKEVPAKPALRVGDIPGFGWFAKTGEPVTTKAAQDFYDIFGELDELYQTVNYYRRLEYPEEYNKAYLKYASRASQYSYAKAYKEQIDSVNARIRITRFSKELSAKDKDVKLQVLYKQRNELYKKAVLQIDDRV